MTIPIPNSDQFIVKAPQATQQGLDNYLGNVAALQDPSGTLQRMQAEQIAKASAAVKTDGITDQFKSYALNAINDYQNKYQQMFGANKGFNRLSLNADQMLEDQKNYKNLLMDVNSLKSLTDDYEKTMERVAGDVMKEVIDPEDYKLFEADLNDRIKNAKNIGDLPSAQNLYNNYLAGRPYDWARMSKDVAEAIKNAEAKKDFGQEGGVFYNTETKDTEAIADAMLNANPKFRNFWLKAAGPEGYRAAAIEYVGKGNKDNRTYAGQVRRPDNININTGSGFDNKKGLYSIPFVDANKEPLLTGTKRPGSYSVKVMNLENQGKAIPWKGRLKDDKGNMVSVDGANTQIIQDNFGGLYMRIQGTYKQGKRDIDIVRDIPYTLDYNKRLHEEKIDVDPIREIFGAGEKESDTYIVNGVEYTKDELGWTDEQINKALSAKKISKK